MNELLFKADLHCHSTCSDGSLSPLQLLELAKEKGLGGLSITDHDTIEAYQEAFFQRAQELNIEICTGVEFSCQIRSTNVHILGYNFECKNEELQKLCARHHERRTKRNLEILHLLAKKGMKITEEELQNAAFGTVIGRPHIAKVLCEKGYVGSIKEAFNHYIGDGKSCFSPGESFAVGETVQILHKAKGKAFIAHPHLIKKRKALRALLDIPFDGLEGYYACFKKSANDKWVSLAKDKGWLVSGGSDFHGELKPQIPLGASFVFREDFDAIRVNV